MNLRIEGVTSRYFKNLPPLINASGEARLIDNDFSLRIDGADVGGLPRTKLAETTSTPDVSISTRTSSCDALYSATSSVMNGMASRLLNVKRMVSAPPPAAQLVSAVPVSTRPSAPAAWPRCC